MRNFIFILAIFLMTVDVVGQGFGDEYSGYKACKSLKKAIKNKNEVFYLDLSNKGLTTLPPEVGELKNLKILDLSHNMIDKFPDWFWKMDQIEILILADNHLAELPEGIGSMSGLKRLYVSRNKLTSVPKTVTQLTNLRLLDLTFNDLIDQDVAFVKEALTGCHVVTYAQY